MGANLCCLGQSSPEQSRTDNSTNGVQLHLDTSLEMKSQCLMIENRKELHQEEKKVAKVAKVTRLKRATLEEWLLASPAVRRDGNGISANEIQALRQSNNRICPWMNSSSPYMEIRSHFSQARDSFSLDWPKKVEETTQEGIVPCLSKSQSGKLKKRVSFRLPEEADIFIFYSPEDGLGD